MRMHNSFGKLFLTVSVMLYIITDYYAESVIVGKKVCQKQDLWKMRNNIKADSTNLTNDVATMKDAIPTLTNEVSIVKDDVSSMKNDISTLTNDVSSLKDDVSAMKNDSTNLTNGVATMKDAIPTLTNDVSSLKDDVSSMKNDISTLTNEVLALRDGVLTLKNDIATLLNKPDMKCDNAELRDDMQKMRDDMQKMRDDMQKILAAVVRVPDCENRLNATLALVGVPDCENQRDGRVNIATVDNRVFQTQCFNEWLIFAQRFNGAVDFYRSWTDYKRGFGDIDGEYFLGFNNILSVLKQGHYKLRIELTTWPDQGSVTKYAEYSMFELAGESEQFRITVSGFSGTAGDSMAVSNNMKFSTRDRDHDTKSSNCATDRLGAWWFSDCSHTNLYGPYKTSSKCDSSWECMYWFDWPEKIGDPNNAYYSFKEMRMMIRRI